MDELVDGWKRQRVRGALLPLFFLSGATGLVYQTVWSRQLHLVFGTSTLAVSTVLAAFMGGLALGGGWGGRWADRGRRPLAAYGVLEVFIGVWAAVFPWVLAALAPWWVEVGRWMGLEAGGRAALQWAVSFALLLPPTAAMGATLPLLARFAADKLGDAGGRVGALYAANTAGAVAGTALAGFWLLPTLGLSTTTWIVVVANVLLGLLAWALDLSVPPLRSRSPARRRIRIPSAAMVVAGISGAAGLAAEVAWFRVLALQLGGSTYAFTVMLLAFLVGIAGGGVVGGRWGDQRHRAGGSGAVWRALAWTQVGIAVVTTAAMYLSTVLPYLYVSLFELTAAGRISGQLWLVQASVAGALLLPTSFLLGVAFPLVVRAAIRQPDRIGSAVGEVYQANTVGGMVGAALAGLVLLPVLGIRGTLAVVVAGCLGAAWLASGAYASAGPVGVSARRALRGTLTVSVGISALWLVRPPMWDPLLVTAGMYKYASDLAEPTREGVDAFAREPYRLLFYEEGAATVVTVAQAHRSGNVWLANNGKIEASTTGDMPTQLLVSILPLMLAPERREVAMIGLASGISAGAALLFDDVERLTVVELEPATARAARLFSSWNRSVLDDPRLDLRFDDGRNHLFRTPPHRYDVVISEPSNPWISGVSNLFTAEFFAMARQRLRPGGVWAQWVQLYGMGVEDVRTLLGTFADEFEHVEVWGAAEDADLVVLGSDRPITPTLEGMAALFRGPILTHALSTIDIDEPGDLLAYRRLDSLAVRALSEGAVRNTDDNMRIEYRAPRHLHRGTTLANNRLLDEHQVMPHDVAAEDAVLWWRTARGFLRREEPEFATEAFVQAALRLPEDDPRRVAWLKEGFDAWMLGVEVPERRRIPLENRFIREVVLPAQEAVASP